MRKFVAISLLLGLALIWAPAVRAQGVYQPGIVYAEQFNNWSFTSQGANNYTFPETNCYSYPFAAYVPSYFVFGTGGTYGYYPVYIQDAAPANSEIVTPTAVSTTPSSCGFTATTANSHISFRVMSGTAGLQDAVGTLAGGGSSAVVVVDRYYYGLVSALPGSQTVGGIIAKLKGSANVQLWDITTNPITVYSWNGAQYFANGGGTPAVTIGAGAGTSPTGLTINGNGAAGTVSFTSGASPATGTLFTLTFLSGTTSTGFNHSPVCTVGSVGANTPAGTLAAGSVGGSVSAGYQQPVTIATTALTASTFYSFSYSCK